MQAAACITHDLQVILYWSTDQISEGDTGENALFHYNVTTESALTHWFQIRQLHAPLNPLSTDNCPQCYDQTVHTRYTHTGTYMLVTCKCMIGRSSTESVYYQN